MSEAVKNGIATFISTILLVGMAWVVNGINTINLNVNETKTLQQGLSSKVEKIEATRFTQKDAENMDRVYQLQLNALENRLTTIELERAEYISLLRKVLEQNVLTQKGQHPSELASNPSSSSD